MKIQEYFKHAGFARYLVNTSWMFAIQGTRLFLGFFVGLWLARYLGPEQFGIYNYVNSILLILLVFSAFGTPESLVKELIVSGEKELRVLCSGFVVRLAAGALSAVGLLFYALYIQRDEPNIAFYLLLCMPAVVLQAFEVLDTYNSSRVEIKKTAISRILQLLLSAAVKIYLILTNAEIQWFYYVIIFDYVSYAIFISYSFVRSTSDLVKIKTNFNEFKHLVSISWPLMFVLVSTVIVNRVDQIFIGNILGQYEVGMFAPAKRITELMAFFPTLVCTSLFPAIINAKKIDHQLYVTRLKRLNKLLSLGSIAVSGLCYVFSAKIVLILFGTKFAGAERYFSILSLNLIFVCMYMLSSKWYVIEGKQRFLLLKNSLMLISYLALNFLIIPKYGVIGAVYNSIGTMFFFYFVFDVFFKSTRPLFFINISFLTDIKGGYFE